MKKLTLTTITISLIGLASLTAFAQQDKKAEEARKDVKKAQTELTEAKKDSAADYQNFKKEAELKIADNKIKIAELKAKKADTNKEIRDKYNKKVQALEQKNNNLQNKIDNSGNVKTSMWNSFKREFNSDIDDFGRAFKNIGVDNAK